MGFFDFLKQPSMPVPTQMQEPDTHDDVARIRAKIQSGATPGLDIPTVEDRIKTAHPSKNGLYPHEILLLAYAKQPRIKYIRPEATEFPQFWLYEYGVKDVLTVLHSLEKRDFLLVDDGKYKLTDLGEKEISDNGYVYYIHRYSDNLDMTPWHFNEMQERVPERIKNYSWEDKYWWWLNQQQMKQMSDNQVGLARNTVFSMAEFRKYEGNYAEAVRLLDEVIRLDRYSGSFKEFKEGTPPGVLELRKKWLKKLK